MCKYVFDVWNTAQTNGNYIKTVFKETKSKEEELNIKTIENFIEVTDQW